MKNNNDKNVKTYKKNNKFIDPDHIEVISDKKKVLKKRGNHSNNKNHNTTKNNSNNNKKSTTKQSKNININHSTNTKKQVYKEPKIIKKPRIIDNNETIELKPLELKIIDNNEELHVFEDYNENDILLNFNDEVDTEKFNKKEEIKEELKVEPKQEIKEEIKVKEEPKKEKKKKDSNKGINIIITLITIICLCTFGYSLYNIVIWKMDTNNTDKLIDDINSKVTMTETVITQSVIETNSITESVTEEHKFNPYFDYIETNMVSVDITELIKENKDTTGWVKLEGTSINYPFVRTSNNDYYLNHSFNKKYNESGWIFLDYRNDKDLTKNKNSIIYGHRRADNAMFGTLKNVLKKDWQKNADNHYIKVSLEHYNLVYKVFSIYHIPVTSDYIQTDFDDGEFKTFLDMLIKRSAYNFHTEVNENDSIITLSSCYGNNERVVAHAKLIQKQGK